MKSSRPTYTVAEISAALQTFRDQGSYIPVSKRTVERIINVARARLAPDEPLADDLALLDLHYWLDGCYRDASKLKPHRYYAQRWNWKRSRTHTFIRNAIIGADNGRPSVSQVLAKGRAKGAEIRDDSASARPSVGQVLGKGRAALSDSSSSSSSSGEYKQTRGSFLKSGSNDPLVNEPTIDDVIAEGEQIGKSPSECKRFSVYYAARGWLVGTGVAIQDWRLALLGWEPKDATGAKRGKVDAAPTSPNTLSSGGVISGPDAVAYCAHNGVRRNETFQTLFDANGKPWDRFIRFKADAPPAGYFVTRPDVPTRSNAPAA